MCEHIGGRVEQLDLEKHVQCIDNTSADFEADQRQIRQSFHSIITYYVLISTYNRHVFDAHSTRVWHKGRHFGIPSTRIDTVSTRSRLK